MSPAGVSGVRIHSDLRLNIDGVPATLVADGRQLVLATEDAGRFVARAIESMPRDLSTATHLRQIVARAAALLDESELTAVITTGRGTLIELGHECDSRLGRTLLGTSNARFGAPAAVLSAATGYLRAAPRPRLPVGFGLGSLAVAALFIGAGLRRRAAAGQREP